MSTPFHIRLFSRADRDHGGNQLQPSSRHAPSPASRGTRPTRLDPELNRSHGAATMANTLEQSQRASLHFDALAFPNHPPHLSSVDFLEGSTEAAGHASQHLGAATSSGTGNSGSGRTPLYHHVARGRASVSPTLRHSRGHSSASTPRQALSGRTFSAHSANSSSRPDSSQDWRRSSSFQQMPLFPIGPNAISSSMLASAVYGRSRRGGGGVSGTAGDGGRTDRVRLVGAASSNVDLGTARMGGDGASHSQSGSGHRASTVLAASALGRATLEHGGGGAGSPLTADTPRGSPFMSPTSRITHPAMRPSFANHGDRSLDISGPPASTATTAAMVAAAAAGPGIDLGGPSAGTAVKHLNLGESFKSCCSHCQVETDTLYLCPCGLARYCSTTCQRSHWPLHRLVCQHAVRAIHPVSRPCDWCRRSSQTLRKCGCGFAYYCDVRCQWADWPSHRFVCGTITSEALLTALLGAPTARTTREVATQTAHWQINIPVLSTQSRAESIMDNTSATIFSPFMTPTTTRQTGTAGTTSEDTDARDDVEDDDDGHSSWDAPRADVTASVPRLSRGRSLWEHASQSNRDNTNTASGFSTIHGNIAGGGGTSTYCDSVATARRPSTAYGSTATPRAPSLRQQHHPAHPGSQRLTSLYNSLHVSTSVQEGSTTPTTSHHGRRSKRMDIFNTLTQIPNGFSLASSESVNAGGPVSGDGRPSRSGHAYAGSDGAGDNSGDGGGPNSSVMSVLPTSSGASTFRDQPGFVALSTTSRRIVEDEEQKERAQLYRCFRLARIAMALRVLNTEEEEDRMTVLKEEVRWCVVTGIPAAKKINKLLLHDAE